MSNTQSISEEQSRLPVNFFRLVSGEDLIAEIIAELKTGDILLTNPLALHTIPASNKHLSISMTPWVPLFEYMNLEYTIKADQIVAFAELSEEHARKYRNTIVMLKEMFDNTVPTEFIKPDDEEDDEEIELAPPPLTKRTIN